MAQPLHFSLPVLTLQLPRRLLHRQLPLHELHVPAQTLRLLALALRLLTDLVRLVLPLPQGLHPLRLQFLDPVGLGCQLLALRLPQGLQLGSQRFCPGFQSLEMLLSELAQITVVNFQSIEAFLERQQIHPPKLQKDVTQSPGFRPVIAQPALPSRGGAAGVAWRNGDDGRRQPCRRGAGSGLCGWDAAMAPATDAGGREHPQLGERLSGPPA